MQEETPPGEIRDIRARNQELESQVRELQETLDAIRSGEVDAIVVSKDDARRVYTLEGPDSPYRALVESISEGALTVSSEGMILYANARFASMSGVPPGQIPGTTILDYISPGDLPAFRTSFQGVPKGPCRGRVNLRLGSDSLPVSISMSPLSAEPGSKISVIVTDRREDAEALRESESVLRSFFDAPGDMRGIVEVVAGTDIRHVADNAVTAGFLGLKPEEMRNRLGSELGEPREILHRWIGHYEESRRMGKPVHFEYPDRRGEKEGWLSATVNYLGTNPAGEPRYAYVVRDITDQRQAEDALRRKQTEIQALFDNTPAGLVLFDADPKYRVLVHNRYYQELFAEPFRTRGMAGLSVVDYAPAVEAEGVVAAFDEVVRTKEPKSFLDFPYRSNPPKQSWFNWHMAPIIIDGKVVALVSMSLDVTDRHLAEQALRESEARFRALSETSSLAIGVSSFDGKFLYLNRAYERLFGYTLEELNHVNASELWLDPKGRSTMVDLVREKGVLQDYEAELRRRDGTSFWSSITMNHVDYGGTRAMMATVYDITDRRKAEASLRESEERLRLAQEAGQVGVWDLDPVTNEVAWTPELEKIYGVEPGSVRTFRDFADLVHPDDRRMVETRRDEAVASGGAFEFEFRILRPGGETGWVYCRGGAAHDEAGRPTRVYGVNIDITERKRAEEEIRRRAEELRATNEELTRFNRAMVDREIRMIELKREVNELSLQLGKPQRYSAGSGDSLGEKQ